MLIALLVFFLVIWTIGAAISVKADAVTCNNPTVWGDLPLALVCWPIVAVLICCSKHEVYRNIDWSKTESHY
jgi:hypothetical protein